MTRAEGLGGNIVSSHWIGRHPVWAHVLIPLLISGILMALYFSQNTYLQGLVAPNIENVWFFVRREFGALEMLQNLVLLAVLFVTLRCLPLSPDRLTKVFLVLVFAATAFLFLEEIDYGTHFIDLASEESRPLRRAAERNIHNRAIGDGVQLGSYFNLAAKLTVVFGFVLAPLLLHRSRHPALRLLVPSRWCIATVALMFLVSRVAHGLDDAGLGTTDGERGGLALNISEFRELNMYILALLYVLALRARLDGQDSLAESQE